VLTIASSRTNTTAFYVASPLERMGDNGGGDEIDANASDASSSYGRDRLADSGGACNSAEMFAAAAEVVAAAGAVAATVRTDGMGMGAPRSRLLAWRASERLLLLRRRPCS
jgi:hypothetical protein